MATKHYYKPPGAAHFHSMDWMLQNFNLNIDNKGVFHVGAHTGFDAYIYHGLGANYIHWFECNPNHESKAREILQYWHLVGYGHDTWNLAACTDIDNEEVDFYFYNSDEDGTSSLLKPGGIIEKIPGTNFLNQTVKVKTTTLDTAIEERNLCWEDTVLLNVDVQGSELRVLRGAQKLLKSEQLKYIIAEVSFESLYDGGCLAHEVDEYLSYYGFKRIYFRPDCIPTHGDAIYERYD